MTSLFLALLLAAAPVDFDTDVLPVLTKAGCNAGACHGAAAGRGGFKLSLFGGDPAADHRAIARDLEGRRVNLARPDRSLLLLKPTWEIDHEGGQRFEADSPFAKLLRGWIASGAARQSSHQLVRIEIEPKQAKVTALPAELRLRVTAHFDDGTSRDVSHLAVYSPADPAATAVGPRGQVQVLRPGRHAIVVRFLTEVLAMQITAPFPHASFGGKVAGSEGAAAPERNNWIDDEINTALAELQLPAAGRADDAALLRRLTLDLTGRLPTSDRIRSYLADNNPCKFTAETDRLLATPEFTDFWTYKLARWLRVQVGPNDAEGTLAFHGWLRDQVRSSRALNRLAAELIVATGPAHQVGPANFHRCVTDARAEAEHVAESLLAIRLRCANCHNHPLDRWTQDDYHGLAAIFARIDRGPIVTIRPTGDVIHPVTGEPAVPRIPGDRFFPPQWAGRQGFLADWISAKDNRFFARAWVNRLWQSLLGRGLVEPVDDLRDTNPASHPTLLDRLASDFAQHDFSLRHTLREIVTSAAYQRSQRAPPGCEHDDRFYSHALSRLLSAEVLLDAISDATGIPSEFRNPNMIITREPPSTLPLGTRAISVFTPQFVSEALGPLSSCTGQRVCTADAGAPPTLDDLAVQLHWLNGPLVNAKLAEIKNVFHQLAISSQPTDGLVEEYYLRTLSRLPTVAEAKFWHAELAGTGRAKQCEDFAWSLLSSREFVTNH